MFKLRSTETHTIPSLDGLRAFAVFLVFLAHAGWDRIIPGGFGVALFFFLSGYLITSILRTEFQRKGAISIKNFYLRRFFRIYPPLILVLLTGIALTFAGLMGTHSKIWTEPLFAQLLQVSNYYQIFFGEEGKFMPGTALLWSLAVEEHYYLVFPWLLLGLLAYFKGQLKPIAKCLIALCVFALIWRLMLVHVFHVDKDYTYMASDARYDAILWGAVMGLIYNPSMDKENLFKSKRAEIFWFVLACIVLLFCLIYRNEEFRATYRYSLESMAFFPVFYLAIRYPAWGPFRVLNTAVVQWLGKISYSMYLVHALLIYVFSLLNWPFSFKLAGAVFSTILYASLMFIFVEEPLMRLRKNITIILSKPKTESTIST
jgi:peptidoglycan/LPS O-acetylase OafA/YrhL